MKTCRFVAATLGFLLFAVAPAHGQEPINRFSIGIGILTAPDWMDIFSDALLAGLSLGSYRMENRSTFGAIDAQYERFLSGRFAALGAAGFQRTTRDIIVSSEPRGSLTSTHAHLLGGASFHYLSWHRHSPPLSLPTPNLGPRRGICVRQYPNLTGATPSSEGTRVIDVGCAPPLLTTGSIAPAVSPVYSRDSTAFL